MIIKLNNGTELQGIVANGSARHFQGTNRDSIEFQLPKTLPITFDELDGLFSNPMNTNKIKITTDTAEYIHDNYSLKVSIGLLPVVVQSATDTQEEVVEERYSVVMAQKTYKEIQMDSLVETVDVLVMESLGV